MKAFITLSHTKCELPTSLNLVILYLTKACVMWVTEKSCRLRGIFFTPPKISAPKTPSRDHLPSNDLNLTHCNPGSPSRAWNGISWSWTLASSHVTLRCLSRFFFFCEISWKLVNLGFRKKHLLGGGNSSIFYFHPKNFGKMNSFWLIFFKWVGSTTN